jgi:hypothetical protein
MNGPAACCAAAALFAVLPAWAADAPDQVVGDLGRLAGAAVLCGVPPEQIKTAMAIGLDRSGADLASAATKQRFLAAVEAGKAAVTRQGTASCPDVRAQFPGQGAPAR